MREELWRGAEEANLLTHRAPTLHQQSQPEHSCAGRIGSTIRAEKLGRRLYLPDPPKRPPIFRLSGRRSRAYQSVISVYLSSISRLSVDYHPPIPADHGSSLANVQAVARGRMRLSC